MFGEPPNHMTRFIQCTKSTIKPSHGKNNYISLHPRCTALTLWGLLTPSSAVKCLIIIDRHEKTSGVWLFLLYYSGFQMKAIKQQYIDHPLRHLRRTTLSSCPERRLSILFTCLLLVTHLSQNPPFGGYKVWCTKRYG